MQSFQADAVKTVVSQLQKSYGHMDFNHQKSFNPNDRSAIATGIVNWYQNSDKNKNKILSAMFATLPSEAATNLPTSIVKAAKNSTAPNLKDMLKQFGSLDANDLSSMVKTLQQSDQNGFQVFVKGVIEVPLGDSNLPHCGMITVNDQTVVSQDVYGTHQRSFMAASGAKGSLPRDPRKDPRNIKHYNRLKP